MALHSDHIRRIHQARERDQLTHLQRIVDRIEANVDADIKEGSLQVHSWKDAEIHLVCDFQAEDEDRRLVATLKRAFERAGP